VAPVTAPFQDMSDLQCWSEMVYSQVGRARGREETGEKSRRDDSKGAGNQDKIAAMLNRGSKRVPRR
jgi:hypothetical protein